MGFRSWQRSSSFKKTNVKNYIRKFKRIIVSINEERNVCSVLKFLCETAKNNSSGKFIEVSKGFILELFHLFKSIEGLSGIYSETGIYKKKMHEFIKKDGKVAAKLRSAKLDDENKGIGDQIKRCTTGLDPNVNWIAHETLFL